MVTDLDILTKAVLGICAIVRTHSDLSATQQMDMGYIHGVLIELRKDQVAARSDGKKEIEDL